MKRLLCCVALVLVGCGSPGPQPGARPRVGFIPKLVGIPYFNACEKGAREAADELGLELVYNGPTRDDVVEQIKIIDQWAAEGRVDCLCVACNNPDGIARSLKGARDNGIPVVTYDADSTREARAFFVNMATYDAVAELMVDTLAEQLDPPGEGKVAILTSTLLAPNQSEWAKRIKVYAARRYPKMTLLPEEEHGEDRNLGITKAKAILKGHPDLKGIIGLTSVAVPAAAEAVRQAVAAGSLKPGQVKVGGVSTPKDMRDYVKDDTVKTFVLWNPVDLGYLTVHVANLERQGKMVADGTIDAGRLGKIEVKDREVLLGKPIRFTRDNIDDYDF